MYFIRPLKKKKELSSKEKFERKINEENEFEELKRANRRFLDFLSKIRNKKVQFTLDSLENVVTPEINPIEILVEDRYGRAPLILVLNEKNHLQVGYRESVEYYFFDINEESMWELYDKLESYEKQDFLDVLEMFYRGYLDRY